MLQRKANVNMLWSYVAHAVLVTDVRLLAIF